MAVDPIKYKKDSSEGLATAGDYLPIDKNNASKVQKDVNLGNTETPNSGQRYFLQLHADEDTTVYTNEENKQAGAASVETEGTDEDASKLASYGSVTAPAVAGAGFAIFIALANIFPKFQDAVWLPESLETPFTIAYFALAGCTFASSLGFDTALSTREKFKDGDTLDHINEQMGVLEGDFGNLTNDFNEYVALSETLTNSTIDRNIQITALMEEIAFLQAQGLDTTDKQKELNELQGEGEDDTSALDEIRARIEQVQANKAYAEGVNESATSVKDFLNVGKTLKSDANWAKIMCGLGVAVGAILCIPKIANPLVDIAFVPAQLSLAIPGIIAFAASIIIIGNTGQDEGSCASKGSELGGALDNLTPLFADIDGAISVNTDGYNEADETRAGDIKEVGVGGEGGNGDNPPVVPPAEGDNPEGNPEGQAA